MQTDKLGVGAETHPNKYFDPNQVSRSPCLLPNIGFCEMFFIPLHSQRILREPEGQKIDR